MGVTVDKLILEAKTVVSRLSSLYKRMVEMDKIESSSSALEARVDMALKINNDFEQVCKNCLFDESSEELEIFRQLRIEIDDLLMEIQIVYSLFEKAFPKEIPATACLESKVVPTLDPSSHNLIKHLPISEENYDQAYDILLKRFQSKRLLASTYWKALEKCPKANSSNHKELRNLISCIDENLHALKQLNFDLLDFVLFNMLAQKVDFELVKRFEISSNTDEIPSFVSLRDFIEKQCKVLEISDIASMRTSYGKCRENPKVIIPMEKGKYSSTSARTSLVTTSVVKTCILCNVEHPIFRCKQFLDKNPQQRFDVAKQYKLCLRCLSESHSVKQCSSKFNCRKCSKEHNYLLHFEKEANTTKVNKFSASIVEQFVDEVQEQPSTSSLLSTSLAHTTTLLATAVVSVTDAAGNLQPARIIIDNGSIASFMTEKFRHSLGLKKYKTNVAVQGLGLNSSMVSGKLSCVISPIGNTEPSYNTEYFVLSNICGELPATQLSLNEWPHIKGLALADPNFNIPGRIDMLLGADVFAQVLLNETRFGFANEPIAVRTTFGWVLTGKVITPAKSFTSLCAFIEPLDRDIKKFWELENIPTEVKLSPEEELCERNFCDNYTRNEEGRFVVALPFSGPEPLFYDSRAIALKRFFALERGLQRNPELYSPYREFMKDYEDSGHMTQVQTPSETDSGGNNSYYIPHHAVHKIESTTTKLRVVFDASCKDSYGNALNESLLSGPALQKDIVVLLLHFRGHSIVLTADMKQMYLQILIKDDHRDYQKIVWRCDASETIKDYNLNTVTYGVSSAPFLALRTIVELAKLESAKYPLAAKVLSEDTYVDDLVTGCESIEIAERLIVELCSLCKNGGFELRKWCSNVDSILLKVPEACRYPKTFTFREDANASIKILGLQWQPLRDVFTYTLHIEERPCTKRNILSEISIFDPLGFLAPLVVLAKRFIQELWVLGLGWDQEPPPNIVIKWKRFVSELPEISNIEIPRRFVADNSQSLELHGFCDASEAGYAAVIYFRSFDVRNNVLVVLVCAKSKVAPLNKVTLPRLELCAAVLLADLIDFVASTFKDVLDFTGIYAWSDSKVALAWIQSSPSRWKTFVGNRIARIQAKVPPSQWHHVRSKDNPADCASRGLFCSELIDHPLWWAGPTWLLNPENNWSTTGPIELDNHIVNNEGVTKTFLVVAPEENMFDYLLKRFSDLNKILRIIHYCRRFVFNCKVTAGERRSDISNQELQHGLNLLVKYVQYDVFAKEIENCTLNKPVSKQLRPLSPFVDQRGLLRVGGRLKNSELDYNSKFPLLLPKSHPLTELIIRECHNRYLHPGLRTTQFLLMQNYWISAKRAIKKCLKECIRCFKTNPSPLVPSMGNLPSPRVTPGKAFLHAGVDYGGPFNITFQRARGARVYKAYICLFVCLSNKAIHIELASDLSTETFIAAVRRFVARRGRCIKLYCDCGTNFVGAARTLREMLEQSTGSEGIDFVFNPPGSPHFGGLWEAGIKSVKGHLTRVIGDQTLTYVELYTVLAQIEAVLNSRPLCGLSSDPNELSFLTPGHFLNLEPVSIVPDPNVLDLNISRLSRWQLLQHMQQSFWKKWSSEYLHTLQQRNKWTTNSSTLEVGTLVVLKDEKHPPLHWRLGRVVEVHPGNDGIIRVATIKTMQGLMKRPVIKLCPLPIN